MIIRIPEAILNDAAQIKPIVENALNKIATR